jgi:UDP-glucose 4-epimerase
MNDFVGTVVRFANVVGAHQTHGVAYDFIRRLAYDPTQLKILGDGRQTKPYIHTDDIISALRMLEEKQVEGYDVFNVGSEDHLTVTEIADIIVDKMNLSQVKYNYTGGARGWKADVPVYQLNTNKLRRIGWSNKLNSRQAVEASVTGMISDVEKGNITPAP